MPDAIKDKQQASRQMAGKRLDQVAVELFPGYSRARLQQWIRSGELTLDGSAGKPSQKLSGGEILCISAAPEVATEVKAQDLPLAVVHADEHIILVNKPAGLVVHPAAGNPDGTLQNALLHFDPDLAGVPRSGIVHRLDKDTTGIMVVARNLKAHAHLVGQLQNRSMSRVYQAIVHGDMATGASVDAPIGRNPHDRQRMAVVAGGKPAVSHVEVLDNFGGFTHVRVSLESGRTHQIRVHMKHLGYPLVGDPAYGRKLAPSHGLAAHVLAAIRTFPRQALHARMLKLVHPGTGAKVRFEAATPEDMAGLLAVLGQEQADA